MSVCEACWAEAVEIMEGRGHAATSITEIYHRLIEDRHLCPHEMHEPTEEELESEAARLDAREKAIYEGGFEAGVEAAERDFQHRRHHE